MTPPVMMVMTSIKITLIDTNNNNNVDDNGGRRIITSIGKIILAIGITKITVILIAKFLMIIKVINSNGTATSNE